MRKLTASNIVSFIAQLDVDVVYNYINTDNKGLIKIVGVDHPEGPLRIKRWNPSKGETEIKTKVESISGELIWRVANALNPNQPINLDRILGGSYNTRSVLESLLAYTPEFYFCYPGRIEDKGGMTKIKKGHKHLVWMPDLPHRLGIKKEIDTDIVISEIPSAEIRYEALVLPDNTGLKTLNIDVQRRHAQIQIALYFIGIQLGFRTWIAQNDKGILYQNKRIGEYEGIISSLRDERVINSYDDAIQAALMIDCIWFKNGRLVPAVMEVEHSTGVTSGLSRMMNFRDKAPFLKTKYVIVAPDEDREKVSKEANKEQFRALDTRFFTYSAVEELYSLCQKRKIRGVTEEFLDCFMEPVLN